MLLSVRAAVEVNTIHCEVTGVSTLMWCFLLHCLQEWAPFHQC